MKYLNIMRSGRLTHHCCDDFGARLEAQQTHVFAIDQHLEHAVARVGSILQFDLQLTALETRPAMQSVLPDEAFGELLVCVVPGNRILRSCTCKLWTACSKPEPSVSDVITSSARQAGAAVSLRNLWCLRVGAKVMSERLAAPALSQARDLAADADSQSSPSQTCTVTGHTAYFKSPHSSTGRSMERPCLMVLSGHSNRYEPSSSLRKRPTSVLSGPMVLTLTGRCCCGSASLLALLAAAKVSASDFKGFPADRAGPDRVTSRCGA